MNSVPAKAAAYSVVIPVYNGERVLARTVAQLHSYLADTPSEIIIVENGSTDKTLEVAHACANDTKNVAFQVLQSEKGMGNALRKGIQASTGARVLLTADDLPFGIGDLEQDLALDPSPAIVIGSKAHKNSETPRGVRRSISTAGFKILRQLLLGSKVGDSQGTVIAEGEWIRNMVHLFDDSGFLFSTQVVFAAELQGLDIVEVPVTLAPDEVPGETTIRLTDILNMANGLVSLRRKRAEFALVPQGSSIL